MSHAYHYLYCGDMIPEIKIPNVQAKTVEVLPVNTTGDWQGGVFPQKDI